MSKPDGSLRFCVDYRKLNEVTTKHKYPLPRIDDLLDRLNGGEIFSTLDLKAGYWQIPLRAEGKAKTAFTAGTGLYEFQVMPFGLANAPASFQRCMAMALGQLSFALVYLSDIIVFGKCLTEHKEQLRTVFQKLQNAGLKLNHAKCKWFKSEVKFLGYIISGSGIKAEPAKTEPISGGPPQPLLRHFSGF